MTLSPLQTEMIDGIWEQENDLGKPSFTWQNNTYTFIPSISMFQRQLEHGGFETVRLLNSVVRMLNKDGSQIFTSIPQPQQKITYNIDGNLYRIENIKLHPTQVYFTLQASCPFKGI